MENLNVRTERKKNKIDLLYFFALTIFTALCEIQARRSRQLVDDEKRASLELINGHVNKLTRETRIYQAEN